MFACTENVSVFNPPFVRFDDWTLNDEITPAIVVTALIL